MIKEGFNLLEVTGITSNDMLPEWDEKATREVRNNIRSLFEGKHVTDHRGQKYWLCTFQRMEDFFGLPYTSSSSFAGVWNTNTRFCLDTEERYNIDGFAMGKDGKVYVWCSDADEMEKVYQVV